jgi:hypothetical protein
MAEAKLWVSHMHVENVSFVQKLGPAVKRFGKSVQLAKDKRSLTI